MVAVFAVGVLDVVVGVVVVAVAIILAGSGAAAEEQGACRAPGAAVSSRPLEKKAGCSVFVFEQK